MVLLLFCAATRKHAAAREVFQKIPADSVHVIHKEWQLRVSTINQLATCTMTSYFYEQNPSEFCCLLFLSCSDFCFVTLGVPNDAIVQMAYYLRYQFCCFYKRLQRSNVLIRRLSGTPLLGVATLFQKCCLLKNLIQPMIRC